MTELSGDQSGTHTVVLSAGTPAPAVGGFLVAPPSEAAPNGVLGRVTGLASNADGSSTVTLMPARLDEAYEQVKIDTTVAVDESMIVPAPGVAPAPFGRRGGFSGLSHTAHIGWFTCTAKNGVEVEIALDDKSMSLDFQFDMLAQRMKLVLTYSPSLTLELAAINAVSCTLKDSVVPKARIPVSAVPPLFVEVEPEFKVDLNSGSRMTASVGFEVAAGFEVTGSTVTPVGSFAGNADFDYTQGASGSAFLGVSGGLSLAGALTGGFEAGPRIDMSMPHGSCMSVKGSAEVAATIETIVDSWKIRFAPIRVGELNLTPDCTGGIVVTSCELTDDAPVVVEAIASRGARAYIGEPFDALFTTDTGCRFDLTQETVDQLASYGLRAEPWSRLQENGIRWNGQRIYGLPTGAPEMTERYIYFYGHLPEGIPVKFSVFNCPGWLSGEPRPSYCQDWG